MTETKQTETKQVDRQAVKYIENAGYYNPSGFTLGRQHDVYQLIERVDQLSPSEHISAKAIAWIYGYSVVLGYPFTVVSHKPSHTMEEKAEILSDGKDEILEQAKLLKTVTLRVEHEDQPKYFLVAGINDFSIDGQAKKDLLPAVKRTLRTDKNVFNKGLKINPPEFDSVKNLGVNPGIVSPFIDLGDYKLADSSRGLSGFFYYHKDLQVEGFVAIAASLTDTIIVSGKCFPAIVNTWQGFYLNIPFRFIRRLEQDRVE